MVNTLVLSLLSQPSAILFCTAIHFSVRLLCPSVHSCMLSSTLMLHRAQAANVGLCLSTDQDLWGQIGLALRECHCWLRTSQL